MDIHADSPAVLPVSDNPPAAQALIEGAARVLHGKRAFLEVFTAGILAGGHLLLDDRPGMGKTTLAKTFAQLIGRKDTASADDGGEALTFKRIQFTPDLLPYDITGVDVFDPQTQCFRFVPGPVMANIVLADEINRATAKVQSALLEVMAERQVTIGQTSYKLPEPFFVIATHNPAESEGTFPLPAAQLDRFMMRLSIGYPDRETEIGILKNNPSITALPALAPVITAEQFMRAKQECAGVFCHESLIEAIAGIVQASRVHKAVVLGASPRAALHLLAAVKAFAWVHGRDFVTDEDINALAPAVLAHRIKLKDSGWQRGGESAQKIISDICTELTGKAHPL